MFRPQATRPSRLRSGFELLELIFHATVRALRKSHGNAVVGLVMSVVQAAIVLVVFVVMFDILGMRRYAIRGDFILYVMSGVFMFLTHTKALAAVAAADAPASAMMMHAPMNPIVAVTSAALASLYQQTLAAAVILLFYHTLWTPITIHDPVGTLGVYILSWFSGAGIGLIFYAAKPWNPDVVLILSTIWQRANMIASGKMFVANTAPVYLRNMFDWNPLFHTIDQGRGEIFLNYHPRFTSIDYPVYCALVCIMIGLMGQFFTRKYASASWETPMIRVLLALFLLCGTAQAQSFPAAYQVQGVAADDVLNIRAEPSATSTVIGALGPYDTHVEVLGLSEDGKWGLVALPENAGWVSMRFLAATPPDDPALIPRPFTCVGTEPFWSLALHDRGDAEWSTPDTPRTGLTLTEEHVATQGYFARAEEGPTRIYSLTVTREWCTDGMSDREYGFLAKLFIESPDGNLLLSGCCTLDAR